MNESGGRLVGHVDVAELRECLLVACLATSAGQSVHVRMGEPVAKPVSGTVPADERGDGGVLLGVDAMVCAIERKVLMGCELDLDPVQPIGIGR